MITVFHYILFLKLGNQICALIASPKHLLSHHGARALGLGVLHQVHLIPLLLQQLLLSLLLSFCLWIIENKSSVVLVLNCLRVLGHIKTRRNLFFSARVRSFLVLKS